MMASKFRFVLVVTLLGLFGLILPSAVLADCTTVPGNIVANCGFETGDLTDWTQSGNVGFVGVVAANPPFLPHSGSYFASLGPVGSDGYLSQSLATTAGTTYQLQWYLGSDGGTPNDFDAEVSGVMFTVNNLPGTSGAYLDYMLNFVAAGPTTLSFSFRDDPGYLALDDISVTPVAGTTPEPSSVLLFATGLMALGGSIKRKLIS
jgi:PEP-CTERM motif